jgi:hypothetical protein
MNDSEIRERLRNAVGEQSYPADLSARAEARLKQPAAVAEPHPRALGLVAAILAIAIVAALVGSRLVAYRNAQPRPAMPCSSITSPSPATAQLADADLAAVGFTGQGCLVTPLQITKQLGNIQVTVIGAYADPAHTVLFFRMSEAASLEVWINGDYDWINQANLGKASGVSGGGFVTNRSGASGDYVFFLDAGPRLGADGTAHLTVSIYGYLLFPQASAGSFVDANWTFALSLPVQARPVACTPVDPPC